MTNLSNIADKLPVVRGEYRFNEPLKKYTWLNVGGPADVMYFPADEDDLCHFLKTKSEETDVFVLGGGANLLVRDGGISGIVIKLKNESFAHWKLQGDLLYIGAGMQNVMLGKIFEENSIGGLEFICSIPGSIGGMLRTNAGCFGQDIGSVLQSARVMDKNGDIKTVTKDALNLSYRYSCFPADWIILGVWLQWQKSDVCTIREKIAKNAAYRLEHQPHHVRTAGSTFKNPEGCAAWRLIKESGADKLRFGGAEMSPQHCNFLINDGTATATDIENLICAVQQTVKEKSGQEMIPEVRIVGRK